MIMRQAFPCLGLVCALLCFGCSARDRDSSDGGDSPPAQTPSLTLSSPAGWPITTVVAPDANHVAAVGVVLTAGEACDMRVDAIAFRGAGSIHENLDVTTTDLWVDDGDGSFDDGADAHLEAGTTFSSDDGVATFAPFRTIPAGGSETWWFTLDLSGTATIGETVSVSIPDASCLSIMEMPATVPVTPVGFPVGGANVTAGWLWESVTPGGTTGPGDLAGYSLVHDTANNRLVLFGGHAAGSSLIYNGTWFLDLAQDPPAWSLMGYGGPCARYGHVAGYDVTGQRMVLFGGWDPNSSAPSAETWSLNLNAGSESWSLLSAWGSVPTHTVWASGIWPSGSSAFVLFGGCDNEPPNNPRTYSSGIYMFQYGGTGGTWSYVTTGNASLAGAAVVDDPANQQVLFFGGKNEAGGADNYVATAFTFNWFTHAVSNATLSNAPGARWRSTLCRRPSDGAVLLFGGEDGSGSLQDATLLDIGASSWSPLSPVTGGPPPARHAFGAGCQGSGPGSFLILPGDTGGGGTWRLR